MKPYRYFLLTALILTADQISKILVVKFVPLHTIAWNLWGDFFRLIHVRNLGMAFSLGSGFPPILRTVMLIFIPLGLLVAIGVYIIRDKVIPNSQRWILAAIIGGGMGNQMDRIFRSDGVVDFLDFKFYGLFGMERWPTFNVADSSLVVCSITLLVSLVIQEIKSKQP